MLNDKTDSKDVSLELATDPTGIGFAFGGVEPGVLHSAGKLHSVHKVSYSIGIVGRYLLHVRLRQAALPVPGSPFTLTVTPGKPHASATRMPAEISKASPLKGMVGVSASDPGCSHLLQTSDKMGNTCVSGGADVSVACETEGVVSSVVDQQDGTYLLSWKSKASGTFEASVRVNGELIGGSPFSIQLSSCNPELTKSTVSGPGLRDAVAGVPAQVRIAFFDEFGNTAIPTEQFRFGLSMLKEKEKLNPTTKEYPHTGQWVDQDSGTFEMTYVAQTAGSFELHVWCDPSAKGDRLPFPGSPFSIHVSAGEATPKASQVSPEQNGLGWSKETRSVDKHGKQIQTDLNLIIAGDSVFIRPQILDEFRNPTTPPEGSLTAFAVKPDGERTALTINESNTRSAGGASAIPKYEVRFECTLRGNHMVHVQLGGQEIVSSPVGFDVLSSPADPANCKLIMPKDEVLYSTEGGIPKTHTIVLDTYDKFGNRCNGGGLSTNVRLQLIKQGIHDQTMLMPNNHEVNITDNNDGTYFVEIKLIKISANIKVIVNMDKNIPAAGGELPPVLLQIVKEETESPAKVAVEVVDITDAPAAEAEVKPTPAKPTGRGKKALQKATNALIDGMGLREERRPKDTLVVVAEAFAEAGGIKLQPPMDAATPSS